MNKSILLILTLTTTIAQPMAIRQALKPATSLLVRHSTQRIVTNPINSYKDELTNKLSVLQKEYVEKQLAPTKNVAHGIGYGILAAPFLHYSIKHGWELLSIASFCAGTAFTVDSVNNIANGIKFLNRQNMADLLKSNLAEQENIRKELAKITADKAHR